MIMASASAWRKHELGVAAIAAACVEQALAAANIEGPSDESAGRRELRGR